MHFNDQIVRELGGVPNASATFPECRGVHEALAVPDGPGGQNRKNVLAPCSTDGSPKHGPKLRLLEIVATATQENREHLTGLI